MADPVGPVAGIILAAGEGSRFGGQKLLAPLRGRPLVQHVLDAANASSLSPLALVVGAGADELLAPLHLGRALVCLNPAAASGQASSLQAGLRAAGDADAAIVLLGDQPGVTAALLQVLVARQRASGAVAVLCAWEGRRMPPSLLHRDLWPAIHALSGDTGAREILAGRDDVAVVEVDPALGSLEDVDTRDDHARLLRPRG